MSYVGFVNYNSGGNTPIAHTLYGTCGTDAATAAKTVSLSNFDKLLDGVTIKIKFTYANTVNSPTLNINSTGAKAIQKASGTAVAAADSWKAGQVVSFTYDNTAGAWIMNDFRDYASTSAPGIVKLESTPTFNLTAKGNGGSTSNVVTTSGLYAAYDNLLGAIGTETLNSGFGSNVSIKAAINSLYTTCQSWANPVIISGDSYYTIQSTQDFIGKYVKIGKLVVGIFEITKSHGSWTLLANLPTANVTVERHVPCGKCFYYTDVHSIEATNTTKDLYMYRSDTNTIVQVIDTTTGHRIYGIFTYIAV